MGVYAVALGAALLNRYGLGDRTAWSFAANSLFLYAFLPLPLAWVVAAVERDRASVGFALVLTVLFAGHWGDRFVPTRAAPETSTPDFRVMTYNALGYNPDTSGTLRVVRDVDADVVALQELAPLHAEALETTFAAKYPYRLLDARPGVTGCGILSRHPLRRIELGPLDKLPWVGRPMAVEIDVGDQRVVFVNFHTYAGPMYTQMRENQAHALAEFAAAHAGPLILAGDMNATDQNEAYAIVTRSMHDAWREAGFGFGHTFPGKPTPDVGGSRPVVLGIPVPMWLVRIDYIFYSDAFVAIEARLGPDDAGSDHRPVVATFSWRK